MTKNSDIWGVTRAPQINTELDHTGSKKAISDFEKEYPTLAEAFKENQQ